VRPLDGHILLVATKILIRFFMSCPVCAVDNKYPGCETAAVMLQHALSKKGALRNAVEKPTTE